MARGIHPSKEVRKAIRQLRKAGRTIVLAKGRSSHRWGTALCPSRNPREGDVSKHPASDEIAAALGAFVGGGDGGWLLRAAADRGTISFVSDHMARR